MIVVTQGVRGMAARAREPATGDKPEMLDAGGHGAGGMCTATGPTVDGWRNQVKPVSLPRQADTEPCQDDNLPPHTMI